MKNYKKNSVLGESLYSDVQIATDGISKKKQLVVCERKKTLAITQ